MSHKANFEANFIMLRDFSRWSLVSLTVAGLALSLNGCAHFTRSQTSQTKRTSDQVIKADPRTGDPLTSLEQELTKVHSDRVIVSTALLKSLVKNERLQQNQCKNISGQLEAIKNIDLEETQDNKDSKDSSP
jgi:hypothetical protein